MATDLRLDIFSRHFFGVAWSKSNNSLPAAATEYYEIESLTKIDLEEIFDLRLVQAPFTVGYFYGNIFENIINNDKTKHPKSKEEFCNYVQCTCKSENWFSKLTIFERCFATISFVLTCSEYLEKEISDIKIYAHVSWTEYFAEYIEAFYKAGGWTELRQVANSYARINDLIGTFNPVPDTLAFLIKSSKSIENYMHFRFLRENISEEKTQSKFFEELEIKHGNKRKSAASSWIKFMIQNGNVQSFDAFFIEHTRNPLEVSHLLKVLRNFCDPNFSEEKGQESSSAIIKNVPMQNTTEEKECEDKDGNIESVTRGEDDGTKVASLVSLGAGKELKKSDEWKTVPKKERSQVSDGKVSFGEAVSSSPIFNNVAHQNTAEEKEWLDKNGNIESIAKGEDDGTKIAPLVSLVAGKELKMSNKWKTVLKKGRSQVSDGNNSSSSIFNDVSLQNAAIEKHCRDSGNENFTGCENDGMHNVPYTSSIADETVDISNERKKNRKKNRKRNRKKGLQVSDKSLELGDATRQASSNSIFNHGSLENTAFEKELDGISIENLAGDENDGMDNVLYTSSMDTEELKKSNKLKISGKKAGLQVSDKSLEFGDATRQASSNSIFNHGSLENTAFEKERDGISIENLAGGENDGMDNVLYTSSMETEVLKKSNKLKINGKKAGLQVSDKNVEHSEVTRKVPTNSISVSLQNAAVEKERENKDSREDVAGSVDGWLSQINYTCLLN